MAIEVQFEKVLFAPQKVQVCQLIARCEEEGRTAYKLAPGYLQKEGEPLRHVLLMRENRLAGYACVDDNRGKYEATIAAEGDTEAFVLLAKSLVDKFGHSLIFAADANDKFSTKILGKMKTKPLYKECRMILSIPRLPDALPAGMRVADAAEGQLAAINKMDAEAFGASPGGAVLPGSGKNGFSRRLMVCFVNDVPVGKMNIELQDDEVGIYGFTIGNEHRSKGYGKAFLSAVMQGVLAKNPKRVFLDVAPENTAAIEIYKDAGFVEDDVFVFHGFGQ